MLTQYQILKSICVDELEASAYRKRPWSINGFSYSSDGRALLRIPGVAALPADGNGKFPDPSGFDWNCVENQASCFYLDKTDIYQSGVLGHECSCKTGISDLVVDTCRKCNGTGMVTCWHCGSDVDCDDCAGEGKSVATYPRSKCPRCLSTGIGLNARYKIKRMDFSAQILILLHEKLPNLRFSNSIPAKPAESIGFMFGEYGTGFLMSMRQGSQ